MEEVNRVLKEVNGNSNKSSSPLSAKSVDVENQLNTTPNKKNDSDVEVFMKEQELASAQYQLNFNEAPKEMSNFAQPSPTPKNVFGSIEHSQDAVNHDYEPMDVDESFEECTSYHLNETVQIGTQYLQEVKLFNDSKVLETDSTRGPLTNNANDTVMLSEGANFTITTGDATFDQIDPLALQENEIVPSNLSFDLEHLTGFKTNLIEDGEEQDVVTENKASKIQTEANYNPELEAIINAEHKLEEAINTYRELEAAIDKNQKLDAATDPEAPPINDMTSMHPKSKDLQRVKEENVGRNSPDIFYSPPNTPDKDNLQLQQPQTPHFKILCVESLAGTETEQATGENSENLNDSFGTDGYSTPLDQPTTPNPKIRYNMTTEDGDLTIDDKVKDTTVSLIPTDEKTEVESVADGNLTVNMIPFDDNINEAVNTTVGIHEDINTAVGIHEDVNTTVGIHEDVNTTVSFKQTEPEVASNDENGNEGLNTTVSINVTEAELLADENPTVSMQPIYNKEDEGENTIGNMEVIKKQKVFDVLNKTTDIEQHIATENDNMTVFLESTKKVSEDVDSSVVMALSETKILDAADKTQNIESLEDKVYKNPEPSVFTKLQDSKFCAALAPDFNRRTKPVKKNTVIMSVTSQLLNSTVEARTKLDQTVNIEPMDLDVSQAEQSAVNITGPTSEVETVESVTKINATVNFDTVQNEYSNNFAQTINFTKQGDKQLPAIATTKPVLEDFSNRRTHGIAQETNTPTDCPSILLTDTDAEAKPCSNILLTDTDGEVKAIVSKMHSRRTFTIDSPDTTFTMPSSSGEDIQSNYNSHSESVTPATQSDLINTDANRRRTFVVQTTPNAKNSNDDSLFKMPFTTPIAQNNTDSAEYHTASNMEKEKRRTFNIPTPQEHVDTPVMHFTQPARSTASGSFPVIDTLSYLNSSDVKSVSQPSNLHFPVNEAKSPNSDLPKHKSPIQDHLQFSDHQRAESIFKQPAQVDFFVKRGRGNDYSAAEQLENACFGTGAGFNDMEAQATGLADANFGVNNNLFLNPADFDYLLSKGNNDVNVARSSLLLKFDPILGKPVPANTLPAAGTAHTSGALASTIEDDLQQLTLKRLSPTVEVEEHSNNSSLAIKEEFNQALDPLANTRKSATLKDILVEPEAIKASPICSTGGEQGKQQKVINNNAKMSVDLIKDINADSDCKKSYENSNSHSHEIQNNIKMDEFEKKIKNDVIKVDVEKKLNEAEQREEALIKRITEKDKKISKLNDVIAAYEKAIAELIAEKETLIQNHEKQLTEVKADRDSNYHHLTSLECTFSDLHVKYEKSKEMTFQLKANEDTLIGEKRQLAENLRLQEQRYDKMKNHAVQQLEIANKKIESLSKDHSGEISRLRAQLKKEEVSRASMAEQLQQKTRENEELVKICDELINGQGS